MTKIAGAVFLVLGLASGLLLTLAPFGIGAAQPQPVAWVLFPLLTIGGYLLLAVAARGPAITRISRSAGAALLALAVAVAATVACSSSGVRSSRPVPARSRSGTSC
jgi:hypothetical protein